MEITASCLYDEKAYRKRMGCESRFLAANLVNFVGLAFFYMVFHPTSFALLSICAGISRICD